MTVKQLIKKLSKCPEDAKVLIPNDAMYEDGMYHATCIEEYDDGTILIDTDYKKKDLSWDEAEDEE
ncbi:MAG: hypothetical protein LIR46_07745 [Bacteroidota bacterium]|nr:hypothetical protein [Bacteroidota bacterium]